MFTKVFRVALILALFSAWVGNAQFGQAGDEQPNEPVMPLGLPEAHNPADPASLVLPPAATDMQPQSPEVPTAFSVNTTQDLADSSPGNGTCAASNGQCSLRAAVQESNALSGAQEVTLPNGTYPIGSELTVTGPLTINGGGQTTTIINGQFAARCFAFTTNSGSHTLSGLTIRNCSNKNTTEPQRNGGAIFNDATLTLRSVTLAGNAAFQGGGVYNQYWFGNNAPSLTLDGVIITGNTATSSTVGFGGGGLFNGSRLSGNNVEITSNLAALQGGGFYNNSYHPEIVLRNFKISGNTAKYGGGINNDLTELNKGYGITLENGQINGNSVTCCDPGSGRATGGGGIANNQGIMRLTNVSIFDNVANNAPDPASKGLGYGAGMVNIQFMELTKVSVTNNRAGYGAGIYNGNYNNWANQLTVINGTISGNLGTTIFPDSEGGGIYNVGAGKARLVNTTVTANDAELAGGIRNSGSTVEIKNTILAGNSDDYGAMDCAGTISSLGNNIVNDYQGGKNFTCTFNAQGSDQVGIIPLMAPALSMPVYHALLTGSQAINKGTNSECPGTDIRGASRPYQSTCDIGSYEWNGTNINLVYRYLPIARK